MNEEVIKRNFLAFNAYMKELRARMDALEVRVVKSEQQVGLLQHENARLNQRIAVLTAQQGTGATHVC